MKYNLNNTQTGKADLSFFWPYLKNERGAMAVALLGILLNSGLNLLAPLLIGRALDTYILAGNAAGLWRVAGELTLVYLGAFVAGYVQTMVMGGVGQRLLFTLRNAIFGHLSSLPIAFFNQNKAGDLISRMNNDTDKLNQFFSQSIMQFAGNAFMMLGAMASLLSLQPALGAAALAPAVVLLVVTRITSGWVKRMNVQSLSATGSFSAAVQESLENFKVVIAFNRRDYFRTRLALENERQYKAAIGAGVANTGLMPFYGFMGNAAQLVAITYGVYLIAQDQFTLGLLVSFLTYITRFYDPLRQIASFWASYQSALAAADRIRHILQLTSDMPTLSATPAAAHAPLLEFRHVSFSYPEGKEVLRDISLSFAPGKIYALVGPTGGGKTTTASLIARLFDPTKGEVLLHGRDLRSYSEEERVQKIGFILQDPFLFAGTLRENIVYANAPVQELAGDQLGAHLERLGLQKLLQRFDQGLETVITPLGGSLSAGQKQIIAFMRAILREPELLILDEATANIDTVTEQLLQEALDVLPAATTRVIIAHRLNTIENADEIFFVNGGGVVLAGSLSEALDMLTHRERQS